MPDLPEPLLLRRVARVSPSTNELLTRARWLPPTDRAVLHGEFTVYCCVFGGSVHGSPELSSEV